MDGFNQLVKVLSKHFENLGIDKTGKSCFIRNSLLDKTIDIVIRLKKEWIILDFWFIDYELPESKINKIKEITYYLNIIHIFNGFFLVSNKYIGIRNVFNNTYFVNKLQNFEKLQKKNLSIIMTIFNNNINSKSNPLKIAENLDVLLSKDNKDIVTKKILFMDFPNHNGYFC